MGACRELLCLAQKPELQGVIRGNSERRWVVARLPGWVFAGFEDVVTVVNERNAAITHAFPGRECSCDSAFVMTLSKRSVVEPPSFAFPLIQVQS